MATALYRFPAITDQNQDHAAAAQPVAAASTNMLEQISLTPLSAGDIIDRAVRLYRLHLLAFIRIVLPPTLLAYAGAILWTIGWRNISVNHGDRRMLTMGFAAVLGGVMWVMGKAGFLMVMGAASRALVFHFFNGTPVLARDVYRAVRERVWSLLGATIMLMVYTFIIILLGYFIFALIIGIYFIAVMALTQILPGWLVVAMHFIFGAFVAALVIIYGLIAYTRVVYTPQAMMVEGKGIFDAFGRSFTLAGREFIRVGAVLLFQACVAWSLYALLLVPLGWYSYFNDSVGVSLTSFFDTSGPLWFTIAEQALIQIGTILLAPIVLLSFTLLYLDSRVRKEGFDVELLANRVLPPAHYERKAAPPPAAVVESVSVPRPDIDWSDELEENLEENNDATPPFAMVPPPIITKVEMPPPVVTIRPEPLPYVEMSETETIPLAPVNLTQPLVSAARYCTACGTQVNERARFCAACGGKLS